MYKLLAASITALSLTLATVTPVHAGGIDRDGVGKLLIGLAAIAALNVAIENNRGRDDNATQAQSRSWADLNRF